MADSLYQNVKTPRFFVDYFQYILTTGILPVDQVGAGTPALFGLEDSYESRRLLSKLFFLNPSDYVTIPNKGEDGELLVLTMPIKYPEDRLNEGNPIFQLPFNYTMILNHNFTEMGATWRIKAEGNPGDLGNWQSGFTDEEQQVNWVSDATTPYNGWSYITHGSQVSDYQFQHAQFHIFPPENEDEQDQPFLNPENGHDIRIGAISMGQYFDMPNSPDLSLTMTREYGGISQTMTKGGSTLTNFNWINQPSWSNEPWGLHDSYVGESKSKQHRAGRRVWDLSFSYLSDSDLMADIELHNDQGTNDDLEFEDFRTDTSFLATFMQKTLGGQLRFIFQPDNSDNTPDGFAICTLDQDSISFEQVANNVYNIKLKIVETW